ncbi:MAG: hypothetical protein E7266_00460 [Lachnospiraceae bacterium]|nr:hypothetical protein [Lachnospiraceae bacterium]
MIAMTNYLVAITVIAVSLFITYMVHYHSAIGPGYIEFDVENKNETRIMKEYNQIFDKVFRYQVIVIGTGIFLGILFESMLFLYSVMVFQIGYITLSTMFMGLMFMRSKIYWGEI